MEEYTPEQPEQLKSEEIKRWFQDNLRIIVSIIIVAFIVGGIYSYSKRSEDSTVSNDKSTASVIDNEQSTDNESYNDSDKSQTIDTAEVKTDTVASLVAASKETADSFIETAGRGDGTTVLARRSLANYLEKNPDSDLTKEHKIYIEDYLRKNIAQKGGVHVGTSIEFSKDLIQKAIAQSKNLSEKQLQNLQKYTARVSSLS